MMSTSDRGVGEREKRTFRGGSLCQRRERGEERERQRARERERQRKREREHYSQLVGTLSPVNHKGLYQV